jgi:hypothetical protein
MKTARKNKEKKKGQKKKKKGGEHDCRPAKE